MAGAGVLAVVAPVVAGAPPAGAAQSYDSDDVALTFVTYGGAPATCHVVLAASHDTSAHSLSFEAQASGPDGCFESFLDFELSVSYKDAEGRAQTATTWSRSTTEIEQQLTGVYAAPRVAATVEFTSCDPNASATCSATATVAPK